ncbi:uncharacterized protein LOC125677152 [Ostrea edulis]|uniref:uncharacterized protein LOC125677152 n=1 Tax=Ostrea edulis TaxID=37623 RepID=UPI00209520B5|nr:uncharacterized protein LOC125677152 [Ostrea edulis]
MGSDECVACSRKVSARQHALQCNTCSLWQHRVCDTGISQQKYRQMMKSDETIEFICTRCREDETDRAPAFLRLSQRATSPELRSLVQYIENAWLDSPVWNPRNWSFYRQSIRTNNDVDGYHTRINADIGRGHMSFYIVVPALRREANIVDLTFRLVSEEQILRDQRRKQARLECRLHQCWQG